ncbi:MAG: energy transducer TonB [Desulfobulbaceae bacterium]|nr:energy transducer TonB [Desulfobulbaceae bacterium]
MSPKNPETNKSGVAATMHANQTSENPWASHPEYLDTARLRNITYGNLVLRKSYHKFMAHGILIAIAVFLALWIGYLSYGLIYEWITGLGDEDENSGKTSRVITSITELAPPPPLNETPPPAVVAPAAPPDVGVVKKVKDEEAPKEKTLASQTDIKKALTAGAQDNKGDTTGIGQGVVYVAPEPVQMDEDPPMFVAVEKMPAFVNQVKPQYPEIARKAGMEGQVTISVLIGSDGKPIKSKILKRKPEDTQIFDQAAINAVMESSYQPGVQNGRPVNVWLTVPIRFKLN